MKVWLLLGTILTVVFATQPSFAMEDYYRYIDQYHKEKQDFLNLKERAQQGDADAQFTLAEMYFEGNPPGVPRSAKKAFKWYEMAAQNGHAEAQYTISVLYMDGMQKLLGPNMQPDEDKSREYLEKSAEGGYKEAQKALAGMQATSEYLYDKKDLVEAYKWAVLASEPEEGEDPDQELIDSTEFLKSQLTAAELKKAERLIKRHQSKEEKNNPSLGGYGAYGRSRYGD